MTVVVDELTRFPVKGLSGQTLDSVSLQAGQGFPCDRKFGFARPDSGFDPSDPRPLPKTKFYVLALDASLALLSTEYDDSTGILSIAAADDTGTFDLQTAAGKQRAAEFLKRYLSLPDDVMPQLHEASPHRFTDVAVVSTEMMNAVSIINLDSVSAFASAVGQTVDPRRFRGNIHVSGLAAFSELDLVDREIAMGPVRLRVLKRTRRCPATEVNLGTGERDLKTPRLLRQHYGHMDMGVYAEVLNTGVISRGDSVTLL